MNYPFIHKIPFLMALFKYNTYRLIQSIFIFSRISILSPELPQPLRNIISSFAWANLALSPIQVAHILQVLFLGNLNLLLIQCQVFTLNLSLP